MSVLRYLKQELNFKASEWTTLSNEDRDDLKRWAREEMDILGITHS